VDNRCAAVHRSGDMIGLREISPDVYREGAVSHRSRALDGTMGRVERQQPDRWRS
jgi:hypothetical protein